jgi:hypothetical protein
MPQCIYYTYVSKTAFLSETHDSYGLLLIPDHTYLFLKRRNNQLSSRDSVFESSPKYLTQTLENLNGNK